MLAAVLAAGSHLDTHDGDRSLRRAPRDGSRRRRPRLQRTHLRHHERDRDPLNDAEHAGWNGGTARSTPDRHDTPPTAPASAPREYSQVSLDPASLTLLSSFSDRPRIIRLLRSYREEHLAVAGAFLAQRGQRDVDRVSARTESDSSGACADDDSTDADRLSTPTHASRRPK
jgi:hypothetical protein